MSRFYISNDDDGPDEFAANRSNLDDDEREWEESGCPVCDPLDEALRMDLDGDDLARHAFADPGSALRAASKRNPRNLPCPTCGAANRLTPADRRKGYQCDACADRDERGGW